MNPLAAANPSATRPETEEFESQQKPTLKVNKSRQWDQAAQFQQLFERIVLEAHSNYLSREHHSSPGCCSNSKLFVDALF